MKNKKLGIIFGGLGLALVVGLVIFVIVSINNKEALGELDRGNEITSPGYIMLSAEKENVTIVAEGEYVLTGENKNNISVIIDSKNVVLTLQDATINTGKNAGIINLATEKLIIRTVDGSVNRIFGGNEGKFNAPIYSRGDVEFIGDSGVLIVGNRKGEGAMVLTEDNKKVSFVGGTIVGLNTEKWAENFSSSQKTLEMNLGQKTKRGNEIMIASEEGDVVFQDQIDFEFSKVLVNSGSIQKGKYTFSNNGNEILTKEVE